jgi:hypothetical protein
VSRRTKHVIKLHLSKEADQERVESADASKRWVGTASWALVRSGLHVPRLMRIHQSEMFEIEIYDLVLRSVCVATSVEY